METRPVKPETKLDPMKLYAVCQKCHALLEWEDLNLDMESGRGTCDSCVGPYAD